MGLFSKSWYFHRTARHEHQALAAERKQNYDNSQKPKPVYVEKELSDQERRDIANMNLKDRGIEMPRHPNEVCAPRITTDELITKGMEGMGLTDLVTGIPGLLKGDISKVGLNFSGFVTGATGYLVDEVRKEVDCRERRGPDYEKNMQKYNAEFDYELSKAPKTGKVVEFVPVTDPRHPNYIKPPITTAWNTCNNQSTRDWCGTFYTNGSTHGTGIQWRF